MSPHPLHVHYNGPKRLRGHFLDEGLWGRSFTDSHQVSVEWTVGDAEVHYELLCGGREGGERGGGECIYYLVFIHSSYSSFIHLIVSIPHLTFFHTSSFVFCLSIFYLSHYLSLSFYSSFFTFFSIMPLIPGPLVPSFIFIHLTFFPRLAFFLP